MASQMEMIRARLQEMENRQGGSGNNSGTTRDNAIYPHWNIPEGTTARIRFLPDGDDSNMFFWVERAMIRLPFAGIKGEMGGKPVTVSVPCMEMYGDKEVCPILTEVRTWFKDKSLEDMGRKYWKKRSYVFQGFVRDNPLADDQKPENPIRRFIISPSIYPLVTAALKDPDIDELPTDFSRGLDFSITKTTKGQYADYATSKWARKESALTNDELDAIQQYGLFNLKDFIPKKPTDSELKIIHEMFHASVDGQPYDKDRWGNFYRPAGVSGGAAADVDDDMPVARSSAPVRSAVVEDTPPFEVDPAPASASSPVTTDAPKASNPRADEILAMIRSRKS